MHCVVFWIVHRGYSRISPENTLPAFEMASELTLAKKAPVVIAFSDKPLLYLRWLVDNSNIARLYRSWNVDYITADKKLF